MSQDWTEKYRPKTLDGVIGNPKAVGELRQWADQWNKGTPKYKAVILMGSPGIGKTTSAEALANDMGWGLVEMNASDQRTGDAIRAVALRGAYSDTFSDDGTFLSSSDGGRKLIIRDEADNLFGNADRNAIPAVVQLIRETKQPVILIVNDFYALSKKSSAIKSETLQITFQKATSVSMIKALRNIATSEGVKATDSALKAIADNSNGDMRAAVRDLQSLALGKTELTEEDTSELSNRVVRKSIYDLMYGIFRKDDATAARKLMMDVDIEPSEVLLWVDENLPREYKDRGDLVRGYEKLSRADIYMGRVRRRQYYRFWAYAGDMMTAGVCTARRSSMLNRERFQFPGYMMKLSRTKGVRSTKASLCQKLANYTHNSTKRVSLDILPALKLMLTNDSELRASVIKGADLEADEVALLLGVKSDSKIVKESMNFAAELSVPVKEVKEIVQEKPPVVKQEPVKKEPVKEIKQEVKESAPRSGGQKSLFDF